MKKKISIILLSILTVLFVSGFSDVKAENQNPEWNFENKLKISEGAFTYNAYLSWDETKAWIYGIDIKKKKDCSVLTIPEVLDDKEVVRIGWTHEPFIGTDYSPTEFERNIFFSYIEAYHEHDGSTKQIDRIKKN